MTISPRCARRAAARIPTRWQPLSWLNPLVELAYLSTEQIRDDRTSARSSMYVVNPGIRASIDFRSGLQIVPGISAPIQVSELGTDFSVLGYLSFEHPVFNPPTPLVGETLVKR